MISRSKIKLFVGLASILITQQMIELSSSIKPLHRFGLHLGLGSTAIAAPRYIPRANQGKAPRRTVGTGSRGCARLNEVPTGTLTLLVPDEKIGFTTSTHPVFFWYLSNPVSVPLEFSLVEPGNPQPLFNQEMNDLTPGIMKAEIPENLPGLEPGKTYRWSVALICNADRRSADVIAQALIQRVTASPALEQQLAVATSSTQKSEIYAAAGFWYDAMSETSKVDAKIDQKTVKQNQLALLQQVGLISVVERENKQMNQTP